MRYWFSILLLSLSFCLSNAQAEESTPENEPLAADEVETIEFERPAIHSRSQIAANEFRTTFPEQFIEIPGTANHYPALYLPANAKTAKGLIVFVPGLLETADSVTNIAQLRRAVTDKGWNSLSLNLPDPEPELLRIESTPITLSDTDTANTKESEQSEEPTTETVSEPFLGDDNAIISTDEVTTDVAAESAAADYAATIEPLLNATLEYIATQQAKKIIFIAQHEGAYWLLDYLTTHKTQSINAILLINPRHPRQAKQKFAFFITELDITTVDFYSTNSPSQANEAKERLNASKRKAKSDFQQLKINGLSEKTAQQRAQTKVLGWLHRYQP
ncbi:MAG: alpha/beta hydrolase family protein [Thiopseudomonas sp.]|nr:alpha/beta hydrolase family protein [Thiopseudomonas sp.]MCK9466254.1 alpha/beta hydrolase family protein [Thiopseudomonas sp.]